MSIKGMTQRILHTSLIISALFGPGMPETNNFKEK